jgi:hypothetical protein
MTPLNLSYDASTDYAWISNCMMYGYVPAELSRVTAPTALDQTEATSLHPADNPTATQNSLNRAWLPMVFALMLCFLGGTTVANNPRAAEALTLQVENTVTEMDLPGRWKF